MSKELEPLDDWEEQTCLDAEHGGYKDHRMDCYMCWHERIKAERADAVRNLNPKYLAKVLEGELEKRDRAVQAELMRKILAAYPCSRYSESDCFKESEYKPCSACDDSAPARDVFKAEGVDPDAATNN
jgi:hypothetical protein